MVVVATAAGVSIDALGRRSDSARQVEIALAQVERRAHELNALEWQTVYHQRLDPRLEREVTAVRQAMDRQFEILERLDRGAQLEEVRERYRVYSRLVDQEFQLLRRGDTDEAVELDEASVDPAFAQLSDSLSKASAAFRSRAASNVRWIRGLTYGVLFTAVTAIALLAQWFQRQRRIVEVAALTEMAAAEQRVLRQANEQLEHRVLERTAALEEMNKQIVANARLAGMAEVATAVLHNVGNVLNSANVSTAVIADRLQALRSDRVGEVAALLREHRDDLAEFLAIDPQGRRIPDYLATLAVHLGGEKDLVLKELRELAQNIEHIKQIVAMQQNYTSAAGALEDLPIVGLIEDALLMNADAFERHGVIVRREFQPTPPVRVDRYKVLQILVNLIRNAEYALQAGGGAEHVLTVGVALHDGDRLHVTVRDNGVGIAPENLTNIFRYGFTTKGDGHGFGLHSSANAAREMGGALRVRSDGLGKGATFTLELPAAPVRREQRASP